MSTSASIQLVRNLDRLEIDNKKLAAGEDRSELLKRAESVASDAYALGVPDLIGAFHLRHGTILFDAKYYPAAFNETGKAIDALGDLRQADLLVSVLALRARCCIELQDWSALEEATARGISLVEQHRYKVSAPYLKAGYMRSRIDLYVLGVESALHRGDLATALLRADLCKSRGASGLGQRGADNEETEKLLVRFKRVNTRIKSAHDSGRHTDRLMNERRALWDLIEISRTRNTNSELPVFDWHSVRNSLQPEQVVVYYFWLDRLRLLIIVFDRSDAAFEIKTISEAARAELADFAEGMLAMTEETAVSWIDSVQNFAPTLWPNNDDSHTILQRARRLIISPHRLLHSIPFSALNVTGELLVRQYAVRLIPNLTSLLARHPTTASDNSTLAIGIEHYDIVGYTLRELPLAEREAEQVCSIYRENGKNAWRLPGAEASRDAILNLIEQHKPDILHLACHGLNIESDTPMESCLFLAESALDALEISTLGIGARLVVLSACSSGQRAIVGRGMDDLPGDDIFGLQAAFFAAGARELVASLCPVDTTAARDISVALHQGLCRGQPTDVALQSAICNYIDSAGVLKRKRHYWAPFFLSALGPSAK